MGISTFVYNEIVTYDEANVGYNGTGYRDLFNEAIDDLIATLATITDLRVTTDPQKINPPCVFLDAPTFDSWSSAIVKMTFAVKVISLGPGNLDAMRNILNITAKMLAKKVGVTAGRPGFITIGGQDFPCYDIDISLQAQASAT